MNHYYDYLYRKRLGLETTMVENDKEVKEAFYKLCDILDKLEAKQKSNP